MMPDAVIYHERVRSNKTEALFLALLVLFFMLLIWRVIAHSLDFLAIALLLLSLIFLFYTINYRTLEISLSAKALRLQFGVFRWKIPLDNMEDCRLDELPLAMRLGGAGIHFMMIHQRYRASFNFLEYPRVVVALKKKAGPVQEISFSTRRPDEVLRLLSETKD